MPWKGYTVQEKVVIVIKHKYARNHTCVVWRLDLHMETQNKQTNVKYISSN